MILFGQSVQNATRFVVGDDVDTTVDTAMRLFAWHGMRASLFCVGEYVVAREAIEFSVKQTLTAIEAPATAGPDVPVSIDPTATGYMESDAYGIPTATLSAQRAARHPVPPGRRGV
jgi:proline dehydrogenase